MKDPHITCEQIAQTLKISSTTAYQILTNNLALSKVNIKWVPYQLNDFKNWQGSIFAKILLKGLMISPQNHYITSLLEMKPGDTFITLLATNMPRNGFLKV